MTPLMRAVEGGYLQMVELLLSRGAEVNYINNVSKHDIIKRIYIIN